MCSRCGTQYPAGQLDAHLSIRHNDRAATARYIVANTEPTSGYAVLPGVDLDEALSLELVHRASER